MIRRPAKATIRDARTHNQRLVLSTIYEIGPASRAHLARLTGLTRTTVSDVVGDLLKMGLTREIGPGPSRRGKAPILLEVPPGARHVVGIDLDERVFRGAIVNLNGEMVKVAEVPCGDSNGERALERVDQLLDRLLGSTAWPVLGIGIGAPGLINTEDGTVVQAVNIDWRGVPLGAIIGARWGLPVYVINDSQVAALAEHSFGTVRRSNLVAIKVSGGIGAGFVLNGSLYQGDGPGAGEIGHTIVAPGGPLCQCGRRGCLQTVASTRAVLSRIGLDRGTTQTTLEEAVAAFQAGDEIVVNTVLEAGRYLGSAIAGIVGALNVHHIVLVGTMPSFGERWLAAVRAEMSAVALPALARDVSLELGQADDIVIVGSAALLVQRELGLNLRLRGQSRKPSQRSGTPSMPSLPASLTLSALSEEVS
jgi:predicted NBD/HSP70 family sugar kinase